MSIYDSIAHLFLFLHFSSFSIFFFFNDTATTEIYTLSLHDALPISQRAGSQRIERGPEFEYRHRTGPVDEPGAPTARHCPAAPVQPLAASAGVEPQRIERPFERDERVCRARQGTDARLAVRGHSAPRHPAQQ